MSENKEDKRNRFLRIKGTRLLNLDVTLSRIGKLSNKQHFHITEEDKINLFNEIDEKINNLKSLFQ